MSTERGSGPGYLTLICHGETRATRLAAFPADDPLEEPRSPDPTARLPSLVRTTMAYTSPDLCARQTALALGLEAREETQLRECDFGRWQGRRLTDIHADDPEGLSTWFHDSSAKPHGGESLAEVGIRARQWLERMLGCHGRVVAVTSNTVMRQIVLSVLEAPSSSFWRVDVAPWGCIELTSNGVRWALRAA